jgi:enoyl-CoA hydratase
VAATELEAAAESLAADLLRAEPLALALTKQALNANLAAPSLEAALEMEDRQQTLMASGPEFAARIRAFLSRGEQTRD